MPVNSWSTRSSSKCILRSLCNRNTLCMRQDYSRMRAKARRGVDSLQKCTPGISKKHSYCFSIWCNRGLLTRFNILVEVNPIFRLPFTGTCNCSLPCSEHALDQMTQRGLSQPTSPPRSQFFLRQGILCSAPRKRTRYAGQAKRLGDLPPHREGQKRPAPAPALPKAGGERGRSRLLLDTAGVAWRGAARPAATTTLAALGAPAEGRAAALRPLFVPSPALFGDGGRPPA